MEHPERQRKGKHLSWNDRLTIERMLLKGYTKKDIAAAIGCCLATIYNEVKRSTYVHTNGDLTEEVRYNPDGAQSRYETFLRQKGSTRKLVRCPELSAYIEHLICQQHYSPEAALNELRNNNIIFAEEIRSVNTVYSAIEAGIFETLTLTYLPQGRKKHEKRSVKTQKRAVAGTSIENRPIEILSRDEFGNWEMDCVIGKSKNKKTILVLTERKTRMEIVEALKSKTAEEVSKALNRIEKRYGKSFYDVFKTITVDNGPEFSDPEMMEKALYRKGERTKIYYCHPYSSYERGSNENNNRFVRRFFPKGSDFDVTVNRNNVKDVEFWINTYPRPMFNGRCARELYLDELIKLGCPSALCD